MSNPFFNEYKTPFQVPPFNEIKLEHYLPATEAGITEQLNEIKAILNLFFIKTCGINISSYFGQPITFG